MEEIFLKKCSTCGEEKSSDCFYIRDKNKELSVKNLSSLCKDCSNEKWETHQIKNKEKIKREQQDFFNRCLKDDIRFKCCQCLEEKHASEFRWTNTNRCARCVNLNKRKWESEKKRENPEEYSQKQKKYKEKYYSKPEKQQQHKKSQEKRRQTPEYKIYRSLRTQVRNIFLSVEKKKNVRTHELLGCDEVFFRNYIISKFTNGMTLDNYGKNGWQLDHIIPITLFDHNNKDELEQCCHYTNFQPLWAHDNEHVKSDLWNGIRTRNIPKSIIKHDSLLKMVEELYS